MSGSLNHVHVVAFDVPFPPDYGGVIDIYHKIRALSSSGVAVHLHCYTYGRQERPELQALCASVRYYRRKVFRNPVYSKKPYIVASRNSAVLIEQLLEDDYPILFEGLHCTYYLDDPRLAKRFKIVRTHNIEHEYYAHLEKVESNVFKKYFFRIEAERLESYENVLRHAQVVAAISPSDAEYFDRKFGNAIWIPPFHRNHNIESEPGRGTYVLYHGNLAVGENQHAAMYLCENVFPHVSMPCIIAGNGSGSELREKVATLPHVQLVEHISTAEIEDLVRRAHINILPTQQATGIKLKLINALYMGRHCVVNDQMVENTGLESICIRANSPSEYIRVLEELWKQDFAPSETQRRETLLYEQFNNQRSAELLLETIEVHAGSLNG